MCTIVLLHGVSAEHPLVVAANRDELYARPASGPRLWSEQPRVVAGRDELQGGSWMGATDTGFFVGLTNQRAAALPAPGRRSRGEVVVEALRRGSVDAVRAQLAGLDPADYNAFNLVFGTADRVEVAYARPEARTVAVEPVSPGVHVLANDRLDSPAFVKIAALREALAGAVGLPWAELEGALVERLSDHRHPSEDEVGPPTAHLSRELLAKLQAVCIHTDFYGTRSSTLLALDRGRLARYLFAPGPPCRTAFEDVTALVHPA